MDSSVQVSGHQNALWMSCQNLVQGLCKKVVANVYLIVCIGDLMAVHGAKHYKHCLAAVGHGNCLLTQVVNYLKTTHL